jgi:hypothetical protein
MNTSEIQLCSRSSKPALELISLARLSHDVARRHLRARLLANPNYFGPITGTSFKAVLQIQEDSTYESLTRVVYNPGREQLEATVRIHRNHGYSCASGQGGSVEFVRFYLSYDGGSAWRDQGVRSFRVFDEPGPASPEYRVTVGIGPAQTLCFLKKLPLVRAVLSWNAAPPADAPEWTPVWGSVMSAQIHNSDFSNGESARRA